MSLNDKARAALRRELAKCFPERDENDPGHARLASALSDTAHTGGDWVACSYKGGQAFRVECKSTANNCEPIATCSGPDCRANARLIAAAPRLLSALKAAETLIADALDTEYLHDDSHPGARDILAAARAAIARATGGAK